MNKKAVEVLHASIFTVVLVAFIFVSLLYFINQQSTMKIIEKQALAKEICLISLASKSGTIVTVEHSSELTIEKKGSGIIISDKKGIEGMGYFYDCYGNFELESAGEGKTEMRIN